MLDLGIDNEKIGTCVGISHQLPTGQPDSSDERSRRVAIVPNALMLDKTDPTVSSQYLDFLVLSVK